MQITPLDPPTPPSETLHFYRRVLEVVQVSGIPFLVGGAYALAHYTGIVRHTKDLDLFVRDADIHRTLEALISAGYRAELVFTHWLGKAFHGDDVVDVIFNSGNGLCPVDDRWFDCAELGEVLGARVKLMPAEEMIWQKAYIMERERFDGADVCHLIRARGRQLDWGRVLARFGPHWRVLQSHVTLYGFVYPRDRSSVPPWVVQDLTARLLLEPTTGETIPECQGPLLSRLQYLNDMDKPSYHDPRLEPQGSMTEEELFEWTDAGQREWAAAGPR